METFDRDFNKHFLYSLAAHLLIFLAIFSGGELVKKIFKYNDVEIIRSSIRVDVVGMPKFTIQELKKMEAQPVLDSKPEEVRGKKEETQAESQDVIKKDDLVIQEQGKKKELILKSSE